MYLYFRKEFKIYHHYRKKFVVKQIGAKISVKYQSLGHTGHCDRGYKL